MPLLDSACTGSSVVKRGTRRAASPCSHSGVGVRSSSASFRLLDPGVERVERRLLRRVRQGIGLAPAHRLLLDVREERRERVEVARQVRVELVVVALGAAERRAQPDARGVAHAVGEVDGAILLRLRAALLGRLQQPVVPGGDPLVAARVGQQVARELRGREAVERQVAVPRVHHPVAVAPHRPRVVAVVADAVGVAHEVEPEERHALAVARRGEQAIHLALVRVGTRVALERERFVGRRRQAGQVEAQAAQQLGARGLGRGTEPGALDPREQEGVDRVPREARVAGGGRLGARRRDVGPVRLVLAALLDPAPQQRDLVGAQPRAAAAGERHARRFVCVEDAGQDRAALGRAGRERHVARAERALRGVLEVEAQPRLARRSVRAVAGEAALGQDRPDVAVVADASRGRRPHGSRRQRRSRALGHGEP